MILEVHTKPGSKVDKLEYLGGKAVRVKLKAPPVDGKANDYLVAFLAGYFDVPKRNIEIRSGFTSRRKRVSVEAPEEEIMRKLRVS